MMNDWEIEFEEKIKYGEDFDWDKIRDFVEEQRAKAIDELVEKVKDTGEFRDRDGIITFYTLRAIAEEIKSEK